MCKFHVMTKVGSDVGMAIGGSITTSCNIGVTSGDKGNIGHHLLHFGEPVTSERTSDEPPHDAHNDDMATMPNDDVDDGGGEGEAHAKAASDLPEGRAEAVMEEEDEGNIGHHQLHFGEPVTSEPETKYGIERDVIAAMMDLSSPAAPTPKYPNGSNCDAASAASDNAMRNDEMTTITTGNDERSGGVSGVDDVVPLTRTSSLQAIKRQGSGSNYGSMSTIDDATESSADNNSNDERCLEAHDDIDLVVLPAPLLRRTSASCSICL